MLKKILLVIATVAMLGCQNAEPKKLSKNEIFIAMDNKENEKAKELIKKEKDINITDNNHNTLLMRAVVTNNIDLVKFLVENGVEVNKSNNTGSTPLLVATLSGNYEMVKYLIENGADVNRENFNGVTPLTVNLQYKIKRNEKITQYLIDKNADVNVINVFNASALHLAVLNHDFNLVKILIKKGAKINTLDLKLNTPLNAAKNLEMFKYLLDNGANPFYVPRDGKQAYSAMEIKNEKFKKYFPYDKNHQFREDALAEINGQLLLIAVKENRINDVKDILSRKNLNINSYNAGGIKALHIAVVNKNLDIIKLLLKNGVNPNSLSSQKITALHLAVLTNNMEIIEHLLNNKANPNIKSIKGNTALHLASKFKLYDVAKVLLKNGANPNIKNRLEQTTQDISYDNKMKTLIKNYKN